MNKPVLRKTGQKRSKDGSVGQQMALCLATGRLTVLNLLNDRVNAYPNEDFTGLDPYYIDEVRDYLIELWNRRKRIGESERK